eukprot:TRINITY_DN30538_c0_g1_i1.p1 TRINITY_DN30538_c0_g1~~TRINITY_DN30538_c0_g1_i1.p1  ORF type:complete len:683 (+),score=157.20 TRINITY_DN30538_c0_g1_i1:55-2049(+)
MNATEWLVGVCERGMNGDAQTRAAAEREMQEGWARDADMVVGAALASKHLLAVIYVANHIQGVLAEWGQDKVRNLQGVVVSTMHGCSRPVTKQLLRILEATKAQGLDVHAVLKELETPQQWCSAVAQLIDGPTLTSNVLQTLERHMEGIEEACEAVEAVLGVMKTNPPQHTTLIDTICKTSLLTRRFETASLLPIALPLMTPAQITGCLEWLLSILNSDPDSALVSVAGSYIKEYAQLQSGIPAQHVALILPALIKARSDPLCIEALKEVAFKSQAKHDVVKTILETGHLSCLTAVAEACPHEVRAVSVKLPMQVVAMIPNLGIDERLAAVECLDVLRSVYACDAEDENVAPLIEAVPQLVSCLIAEKEAPVTSGLAAVVQHTVQELSSDDVYPLLPQVLPALTAALNPPSPSLPYILKAISAIGFVAGSFGGFQGALCEGLGGVICSGNAEEAGAGLECGGSLIAVEEEVPEGFVTGCVQSAAKYLSAQDMHLTCAALSFYCKMILVRGDDLPGVGEVLKMAFEVLNSADPSEASIERRKMEVKALELLGDAAAGLSEQGFKPFMDAAGSVLVSFALHPYIPLRAPSMTSLERLLFSIPSESPPHWISHVIAAIKTNILFPVHNTHTSSAVSLLSETLIFNGFLLESHPDFVLLKSCVSSPSD